MTRNVSRRASRRTLTLVAAVATSFLIGIAVAAAPGPTSNGEFYYYKDAAGKTIGYRAINCDGTYVSWGKTSARYANGYMICDPDI